MPFNCALSILWHTVASQRLISNSELFMFSKNKLFPLPGFALRFPDPEADDIRMLRAVEVNIVAKRAYIKHFQEHLRITKLLAVPRQPQQKAENLSARVNILTLN